jgi:hypothetical protein
LLIIVLIFSDFEIVLGSRFSLLVVESHAARAEHYLPRGASLFAFSI